MLGWGGIIVDNQPNTAKVSVDKLDNIFLESDREFIDVLKIDTEGADTWVLQGAEQLLRSQKIKHIFFEENTVRMSQLNIQIGDAQKLLKAHGYKVKNIAKGEWYASIV